MASGRVFRMIDGQWSAIGDHLPVWDHVPPRPHGRINVWVLPSGEGYAAGDVVAFGETGHRLLSPVPPDDVAWATVIEAALAMHPEPYVREWTTQIELWLGLAVGASW